MAVWRRGHVTPRDLAVEARIGHQVAAGSLHHTGRFDPVPVAIAGEPGVNGHTQALPPLALLLNGLEDPPRGPVMSRVPHTKGAVPLLKDPGTDRPQTVWSTGHRGRQDLSLPDPFHRGDSSLGPL